MSAPTDADRAKAAEIAGWPAKNWTELRDTIAAALAAERAAAVADLRARVRALADGWGDQSREWYFEHRYDAGGTTYACGFEDGWEHAAQLLRAAVTDTTKGNVLTVRTLDGEDVTLRLATPDLLARLRRAEAANRAAIAEAWDEGCAAGMEWTPSGPNGVPHDPPSNPYDAADLRAAVTDTTGDPA